jgi:hypothetical protein
VSSAQACYFLGVDHYVIADVSLMFSALLLPVVMI